MIWTVTSYQPHEPSCPVLLENLGMTSLQRESLWPILNIIGYLHAYFQRQIPACPGIPVTESKLQEFGSFYLQKSNV